MQTTNGYQKLELDWWARHADNLLSPHSPALVSSYCLAPCAAHKRQRSLCRVADEEKVSSSIPTAVGCSCQRTCLAARLKFQPKSVSHDPTAYLGDHSYVWKRSSTFACQKLQQQTSRSCTSLDGDEHGSPAWQHCSMQHSFHLTRTTTCYVKTPSLSASYCKAA